MARSPAHTWGQVIGNVLEGAVKRVLSQVADEHVLYLDSKGPRGTRRGVKVVWIDEFGNSHDLDYVMERGGSDINVGEPLAFIEAAWRRYTKHSRNKAQEIQGAVLPVAARYANTHPFLGAIVAGEFTDGALTQLRSHGFAVLYLPYSEVLDAFAVVGIDASSDENTSLTAFEQKLAEWENLPLSERRRVDDALLTPTKSTVKAFVSELSESLLRRIDRIVVLPLAGASSEFPIPEAAAEFLSTLEMGTMVKAPLDRIEIRVEYSNGDTVTAVHGSTRVAIQFLQSLT